MKHQLGKNPSIFPKPCYGPIHPSAYRLWPQAVPWPGCCPPPSGPGRYSTPRLPAGLPWWSDLHWVTPRSDCWAAAVDLETKGSTQTKKTRNKVWIAFPGKILYLKPTIIWMENAPGKTFCIRGGKLSVLSTIKTTRNYASVTENIQNYGTVSGSPKWLLLTIVLTLTV